MLLFVVHSRVHVYASSNIFHLKICVHVLSNIINMHWHIKTNFLSFSLLSLNIHSQTKLNSAFVIWTISESNCLCSLLPPQHDFHFILMLDFNNKWYILRTQPFNKMQKIYYEIDTNKINTISINADNELSNVQIQVSYSIVIYICGRK